MRVFYYSLSAFHFAEELLFSLSETVNISLFQKISSTADSKTAIRHVS